jgi:hypothetical protein
MVAQDWEFTLNCTLTMITLGFSAFYYSDKHLNPIPIIQKTKTNFLMIFFFFWWVLEFAKKVLYYLSHTCRPFCSGYLRDGVS